MPATRKSSSPVEIVPDQRRDEVIGILAAGLARVIGASETSAASPADALASMPAEKLSESGEIGLELSGKTRLSVSAG